MSTYIVVGRDTGQPSLSDDESTLAGLKIGDTFTATLAAAVETELITAGVIAHYPAPAAVLSSTGGITAWTATTYYIPNQLVSYNGIGYICLAAHTSGSAFSGPGANWAVLPAQSRPHGQNPSRYNGVSIDPRESSSSLALTAGSIQFMKVDGVPGDKFVGAAIGIVTAGATLTAAQNWLGVYLPSGQLVGKSLDLSAPFLVTGPCEVGLVPQGSFTEADMKYGAEGYVYVAVVSNGTTKPALARGTGASAAIVCAGSDVLTGAAQMGSVTTFTDLPATMPRTSLQPPGANAIYFAATIPPPDASAERYGVLPGGVSAGNVKLDAGDPYMPFYRMAARAGGWLESVAIETRAEAGAGSSYVGGTFGTWLVRFYEIGSDGFPDLTKPLTAGESFNPNTRMQTDSTALGTAQGNTIVLPAGFLRTKGQLFAICFTATDGAPATNYASLNFVYQGESIKGANARNELNAAAADAYYNLDPREGMGRRGTDGIWVYGDAERTAGTNAKHLPTFVQRFAGGISAGQHYFTTSSLAAGTYTNRYRATKLTRITKMRLYAAAAGGATAQLKINSTVVATSVFTITAGQATDRPVVADDVYAGNGFLVGPSDLVEVTIVTDSTDVVQSTYGDADLRVFFLQGANRQFAVSGTTNVDHPWTAGTGFDNTRSLTVTPVGFALA